MPMPGDTDLDVLASRMLTEVQAVGQVDIGTGDRANAVRRQFVIGEEQFQIHLHRMKEK